MPNPDRVKIEIADHVADVRLTRADKHNALDREMFNSISEAIEELGAAEGVRAVVLSGEGPSFCSGLDFPSFMAENDGEGISGSIIDTRNGDQANLAQWASFGWQQLPMPVIGALHGVCYGGGFQIALGPDIRFAAPDTRMSVMEMKYGLIPDMGITAALPELVRADVAREITYTGRIIEAGEAVEIGLITRIATDPYAEAMELAARIAANSPDAIRSAKKLMRDAWRKPSAEGLALEEELQRKLLGSPNQLAAVQAAFAKEQAEFEDPV